MGKIEDYFAKMMGGTKNERELRRIRPMVDIINQFYESYKTLNDDELKAKTQEFKYRLRMGETLDDILPEAYAVVKETCRRLLGKKWIVRGQESEWNMIPYDVQLMGAIVLHEGKIAEMATGEGKTLVATMPLYLNALTGKGVHLITVNDYLAQRDCEWMGKIYEFLGLHAAALNNEMDPGERRAVYNADITYGTNNEFGFDYLRDNMATDVWSVVQRSLNYAIVDEVDSVLIDESRTPLIISGAVGAPRNIYLELKPTVANLHRRQKELVNELLEKGRQLLDQDEEQAGLYLLRVHRGDPKSQKLLDLLTSEFWVKKLIERLQGQYEVNKEMSLVDGELYYTIDEKSHVVDITEKGRIFLSGGREQDVADKIQILDELDDRLAKLSERKKAEDYYSRDPILGTCNGISLEGKLALCNVHTDLSDQDLAAMDTFARRLKGLPQAVIDMTQQKRMDKAAAWHQFFNFSKKGDRIAVGLAQGGIDFLQQYDDDPSYQAVVQNFIKFLQDQSDEADRSALEQKRELNTLCFERDKQSGAPIGLYDYGKVALFAIQYQGDLKMVPFIYKLERLLDNKSVRTKGSEESSDDRASAIDAGQEYFELADKVAIPKHISEKGRIAILGGDPDLYVLPDRSIVEDQDRKIQELLDRTLNQSSYDYIARVMAVDKIDQMLGLIESYIKISDKPSTSFYEPVQAPDRSERIRLTELGKALLSDYAEQTQSVVLDFHNQLQDEKNMPARVFQLNEKGHPIGIVDDELDRLLGHSYHSVKKKIEEWRDQHHREGHENKLSLRFSLDALLNQAFSIEEGNGSFSLSRKFEEVERLARIVGGHLRRIVQSEANEMERQRLLRRFFVLESAGDKEILRMSGLSSNGQRLLMGDAEQMIQVLEQLIAMIADTDIDLDAIFKPGEKSLAMSLQTTAREQLLGGLPYYHYNAELQNFRDELIRLSAKKVSTQSEFESLLPREKAYLNGKGLLLDDREMNELLAKVHHPNVMLTPDEIENWFIIHFTRKPRRVLEDYRDRLWRDYTQVEERVQNFSQLLRAFTLYQHDVDYVVKTIDDADLRGRVGGRKGQKAVMIVDQFTGRMMPGRRFSDGLHEALEAKEGVEVQAETQTLATITIQNFFRLYSKLAGMTGTAETEAQEFFSTYKLDVVVIPTNKPVIRNDNNDVIYRTKREKYVAIIDEALQMHQQGRPVLVGTISVDVSQRLSDLFTQRSIPIVNWLKKGDVSREIESGKFHTVLNAKYHRQEAEIVAKAGLPGMITIATNMAGRGTDIKLPPEVVQRGGLHIVSSEKHEARRIDRQLRGRSGRQGDPGSSRFYLSLEDDLMRLFGSDRITNLMSRMGPAEEGERIEHPLITRSIERAQKKVEERNFEIRKNLLEYDNVLNEQRKIIYKRRQNLLGFAGADDFVESKAKRFFNEEDEPSDWKLEELIEHLQGFFRQKVDIRADELFRLKHGEIKEVLREWIDEQLEEDLLFRQMQLRHRILGYCPMDYLIAELVRQKLRLHGASSQDVSRWNWAGIRYELDRIFNASPDWIGEGLTQPGDEVETRLIKWAQEIFQQKYKENIKAVETAIFARLGFEEVLKVSLNGLANFHLSPYVATISWNTEQFFDDIKRLFFTRPEMTGNELKSIKRERVIENILNWLKEHVDKDNERDIRHRIIGYFSSLGFADELVAYTLGPSEDGGATQLLPQQSQFLTGLFGDSVLDMADEKSNGQSLRLRLSNQVRQVFLGQLRDQQIAYKTAMLSDTTIEEFIEAAVSAVTKSTASRAESIAERQKTLSMYLEYMLLKRPDKSLPDSRDPSVLASFTEDMVTWSLSLHQVLADREDRMRQAALSSEIVRDSVIMMIDDMVYSMIENVLDGGQDLDSAQIRRLGADCRLVFRQSPRLLEEGDDVWNPNDVMDKLNHWARQIYEKRIAELGREVASRYERYFVLEKIDENWRQHLHATDELREGIGLRGYGQKDPLLEYKSEAYKLFVKMIDRINRDVVSTLFRVFDIGGELEERQMRRVEPKNFMMTHSQIEVFDQIGEQRQRQSSGRPQPAAVGKQKTVVKNVRVGRNDPCPCGSGKKYKHCCGKY